MKTVTIDQFDKSLTEINKIFAIFEERIAALEAAAQDKQPTTTRKTAAKKEEV